MDRIRYSLVTRLTNRSLASCRRTTHDPSFVIEVAFESVISMVRVTIGQFYLRITKMPPPSSPSVLPTGALALSKVI